jgi:LysR family transcriptional activator of nhaA
MARLNYHHLYYFWRVARNGNLTSTANTLHVSQSALSAQIKQLEDTMDVTLFLRQGRKLTLTEAGQRTLMYADDIFSKGEELETLLRKGMNLSNQKIRIGMLSTMSRNFIENFIAPLQGRDDVQFSLHARGQVNLLNDLANHQFDLALTNIEVRGSDERLWQCRLIDRQAVAVIGPPGIDIDPHYSDKYQKQRWVLPVNESPIRAGFDGFCAVHQLKPDILAEADDMAMLRLLARDNNALTVLPDVVVKDELAAGRLIHYMTLPDVYENFYAVTVKRQFQHQIIQELMKVSASNKVR